MIAMKQVLKIEADRERVCEAIASLGEICRALLNHATSTSKRTGENNKNKNSKHDDDYDDDGRSLVFFSLRSRFFNMAVA